LREQYNAHYVAHYDMPKKTKKFEAYPPHKITVSDEVWEQFKNAKLKSNLTWTNFIKQLIERLKK